MNRWIRQLVTAAWLTALVIVLAGLPSSVQAQGETLKLLNIASGQLDAATAPEVSYTFALTDGFIFGLSAWVQSGNLALNMTLSNAAGEIVGLGAPTVNDPSALVIESISAAGTTTYTVTLRAGAGTSGEYRLLLLPGYSDLVKWDDFEHPGDTLSFTWEPVDQTGIRSQVINGVMQMEVFDSNTFSWVWPVDDLKWTDMYLEGQVQISGTPSYIECGLLVRADRDLEEFYTVVFSNYGDWAVFYFSNDQWTEVQPWTTSPLIDFSTSQARLGVWVNGPRFVVFFNDQYVGEVYDAQQFRTEGTIGMAIATAAEQTDQILMTFDDIILTAPTPASGVVVPDAVSTPTPAGASGGLGALSGLGAASANATATAQAGGVVGPTPTRAIPFGLSGGTKTPTATQGFGVATATSTPTSTPTATQGFVMPTPPPLPTLAPTMPAGDTLRSWTSSNPQDILRELQSYGLVPATGSSALTVPTSYGETMSPGFSFYPLGQGRSFRNFALGFDAYLEGGAGSACGMHIRATDNSTTFAVIFDDGAVLLGQANNDEFHPDTVFDVFPWVATGSGASNHVVIVAREDLVRMYVNGQLVGERSFVPRAGTVALELFVDSDDFGNTQSTYCQLDNIWLWEF